MEQRFVVAPEVFERFAGMRLAVVIVDVIDNRDTSAEIATQWRAAWREAAQSAAPYGNAQSHPRVRPWREHFQALGVSGKVFPSSIEALLRRALKGGEPFSINPLVDFYNTLSLRHIVPLGGFDLAHIHGLLELRLTREGDTFTALDEQTPLHVPAGEVAYANGQTILTRHFVWRQAQTALITPSTQRVFLVSEILGEVGQDVAEAVLADLREGMERFFGVVGRGFMVDEDRVGVAW